MKNIFTTLLIFITGTCFAQHNIQEDVVSGVTDGWWSGSNAGDYMEVIKDIDGNGADEILFNDMKYDQHGAQRERSIRMLFGQDSGMVYDSSINLLKNYRSVSAGDVNGDGFPDIVSDGYFIYKPYYPSYQVNNHILMIYGTDQGTGAIVMDTIDYTNFHPDIVPLGDINADGFSDIGFMTDSFRIHMGSASGLISYPEFTYSFGVLDTLAMFLPMDDWDGDGTKDLMVLLYKSAIDGFVLKQYAMDSTGIDTSGAREIEWANLGWPTSIAGGKDLNKDGYPELALGFANRNLVKIVYGDSIGLSISTASTELKSPQETSRFGSDVDIIDDVNGDGFCDVLIGAEEYYSSRASFFYYVGRAAGAVFLYTGNSTTHDTVSFASFHPNDDYIPINSTIKGFHRNLGHQVAGSFDFNGDGYSDIAVSDHNWVKGHFLGTNYGLVIVYYGGEHDFERTDTSIQICDSFKTLSGVLHDSSSQFYDTLNLGVGWHTKRFVDLTVHYSEYDSITIALCDTTFNTLGGLVIDTTSIVDEVHVTSEGCPLYMHYNISYNTSSLDTIALSGCDSTMTPSGTNITKSGEYMDTLTRANGCDSVLFIQATIYQSYHDSLWITSCLDFTTPSGLVLNSDTSFVDSLTTVHGCDSTYFIRYFNPGPTRVTSSQRVCDAYVSPSGKEWTSSGTYYDTLSAPYYCDSIFTIELIVDNLDITQEPADTIVNLYDSAQFSLKADPWAEYYWETDLGFGFQKVSNAGQYSNPKTSQLTIWRAGFSNHRQLFRCVISNGACIDTSNSAYLFVKYVSSINEIDNEGIKIYPNPSYGDLTVSWNSLQEEKAKLTIYNSLGQLVYSEEVSQMETVEISELTKGSYIVVLEIDDRRSYQRVVVQ